MTFISIVLATLAAGLGSVWLAAGLMRAGLPGTAAGHGTPVEPHHLLSLAAGALLAVAFMHLLPEAFESGAGAEPLFTTLLAAIVFFFLLDKAELWHHGHEHGAPAHGDGHESDPHGDDPHGGDPHGDDPHHHHRPRSGGWAVLMGDSVHCFGDGILIASAFIADPRLGWVAAVAVLAHEVPHHIGDLAVVRMTGNRRMAVAKVSLAGALTAIGGIAGYWLVDRLRGGLPYFLVIASSSFIYVALADLIPQLQRRLSARETAMQVAWLAVGIGLVVGVSHLAQR
jgi:zinc and cadmium transporter